MACDHTRIQGVTKGTQGGLHINLGQLWSSAEVQQMMSLLGNESVVGADS